MDKPIDDPVRAKVAAEFRRQGLNFKSVSEEMGKNPTYMQQYVQYGRPKILPEDVRAYLSVKLGLPESDLRGPRAPTAPRQPPNAQIGPVVALGGGTSIPVMGAAEGGRDGRFVFNGNTIADVLAPPILLGVRNAYALYVAGDSMLPRYQAGETAYVHPTLPVRQDDFVAVQIRSQDGEPPYGYIKQFISMDNRKLRLRQLNPPKTLEFPRKDVISVHRIVMAG